MLRKHDLMYELFGKHDGAQCKDCDHLIRRDSYTRKYYKCELYGDSCAESTDWTIRKTACGMFNKDYDADVPIVKLVRTDKKDEVQIEGQLTLMDYM